MGRLASRRDEPLVVDRRELGIGLGFGDQLRNHAPVWTRADAPDPGSKECEQVGSERAGVGRLAPGGVPLVIERIEGERLLARPPAVDRGLAHIGAFGDLVHAHRVETLFEQQLRGGVEDRRARLLATGPASPLLLTADGLAHCAGTFPSVL